MTEVKFVEISNRYLVCLDDIISVDNGDERISIRYFYTNSNHLVEKQYLTNMSIQ